MATNQIYGMPPIDPQQMEQFKAWQAMQSNQQMMQPQVMTSPGQTGAMGTNSYPMVPANQQQNSGMMHPGMMPNNNGMMMMNNGMMMPNNGMMNNGMMMMPNNNGMMMMPNNGMMMPNGMMMMPNGMMANPMMMNMYMGGIPTAQPQAAAPSKVPPKLQETLDWIVSVASDWEGKVFADKKMKPDQILPSVFQMREKWNNYFAEYKKNVELGTDTEFKALLENAAAKTTKLVEMLRLRKKKTRPFMNSTRLTQLCDEIDKMIDYSAEKKQKIVADVIVRFNNSISVENNNSGRIVLNEKK